MIGGQGSEPLLNPDLPALGKRCRLSALTQSSTPLPQQIRDKFQLRLPPYPGVSQAVRIGGSARTPAAGPASVQDMRQSYGAAGQSLDEADMAAAGPLQEFDAWWVGGGRAG